MRKLFLNLLTLIAVSRCGAATVLLTFQGTVDNILSGSNAQGITPNDVWTLRLQYEDLVPPSPGMFLAFIGSGPTLLAVRSLERNGSAFSVVADYNGPGVAGAGIGLGFSQNPSEANPPFIYFSASNNVIIYEDKKLPASALEWDFMATEVFTLRSELGAGADMIQFESHTLSIATYTIVPEPSSIALFCGAGFLAGPRRRPSQRRSAGNGVREVG